MSGFKLNIPTAFFGCTNLHWTRPIYRLLNWLTFSWPNNAWVQPRLGVVCISGLQAATSSGPGSTNGVMGRKATV